ncbi:3-hydroxyacyl-CoA dehydrogenase [Lentinula edodes]|nr:3-hydroxyacyl-CoA dehydrogenase [Lentinula edodes]
MRISNRTFVISGGSSGLGLATVQELLRCNAYVAVLDLSPISAEPVSDVETCSSDDMSQNPRVLYIETDVTQEDRVESAVDRIVEWTKSTGAHLGGVINGAGIALAELTINRRGEPHSTRTWDRVLGINLTGTFYLTRLVAKHLVTVPREYELEEIAREREEDRMTMKVSDGERGVIVMIASTVAYEGQAGQIAYAASKGAIRSMTLPMARDMSRYGVRVVTIAPGPFKTPMTGQFSQSMTDRLEKEAVLFPKRYGMPEEFAATVRWILECPYVNGETFKLTGGTRVPAML